MFGNFAMVVTESISKQLVNFFSGFLDSMVNGSASGPFAKRKVEVLAEVGSFFFHYRLGSAFAALVRGTRVVEHPVEAIA